MASKSPFPMRIIMFIFVTWWCTSFSFSQPFYEIYGPEFIQDICYGYDYGIETSAQITHTDWYLIPDYGIAFSGSLYNIFVVFPGPGTYILVAVSTTLGGQQLSDSITIQAYGQIPQIQLAGCFVRDSTATCAKVCAFSQTTVFFPFDAQWDIEGAESVIHTGQSTIEITWGDAGYGKIFYYSSGCENSQCIEILPEPVADFTTTPLSLNDTLTVCKGQEITFHNLSFNGLTYLWQFGDGTDRNSFNASHRFIEEGYYTVTLTAESICTCLDQKQLVINVLPTPVPTLDCVNTVCPGTRQRYTATTDGCTQFNWSVSANGTIINGGGSADDFIEIIWHEGPDGIIELSVDNCSSQYCSEANIFRIPILTPDGPVSGDSIACSGNIDIYQVPYFPGTQYQWQVGAFGSIISGENTNTVTIQWNNGNIAGTSFVAVQYENCFLECGGEDILPIRFSPDFKLSGDSEVCENGDASVHSISQFGPAAQVQWHIENDQGEIVFIQPGLSDVFTHTFSYLPGQYEWVATNLFPSYCNNEVRFGIHITALPHVPLGILSESVICPGQSYGFTIDPSGHFATEWTITDGASIYFYQGQTCQHTFGAIPPYVVSALHTDIQYSGCASNPVSLTLQTAADHTIQGPSDVCLNAIDLFSFAYINGAEYEWQIIPEDHGEIKRTDLNTLEVFWTQTGPAKLRLQACGQVFEKYIEVYSLPVFNLVGPLAACANELVAITTDQPLLSHTWSDDENNIIGIINPVSLSSGHYSVLVKDAFGCADTKPFEVSSFPVPSIYISTASPNVYCNTIPPGVEIIANTDGANYVFTWYKDGVMTGSGMATYSVTDFGTYHAEVTNQYGCKSISDVITFIDCCFPADCSLLPACFIPGCAYIPQDFDIVTSGMDCQSRQYIPLWPDIIPDQSRWSVFSLTQGTIAIVEEDILTYDYDYPGYYMVTMTGLINGHAYLPGICGHFQELRDTIRAIADFSYHGQCAGDMITFEDLTTFLPDESIASWSWDFGDPLSGIDNTSSLQDPIHIFSSAGDYDIRLTATLLSGCSVTKGKSIHVSAGPVLAPSYDPVYCEHEALAFHLPGDVFDIIWDFGDGLSGIENTSASDSPFHTFRFPGIYTVVVSASDVSGCRRMASFNVDIHSNALTGNIVINPSTTICYGDSATLISPAGGISWLWSTGESTAEINVTESNQYNVFIIDQYQCTYSPPPIFVPVSPKPEVIVKAREIFGSDEFGSWETSLHICHGSEFEIQVFSPGDITYQWGNGTIDQGLVFTDEGGNLPGPGNYQFVVLAWDNSTGCISDSSFIEIEIYSLPSIPLISITTGSGCSGAENELQVNNPEPGVEYYWSDGQVGISMTTEAAGRYYVTAVNANGCSQQSSFLTIKEAAPIDQIPGGCHIKCDPLTVCLPPVSNVMSWAIFQNGIFYASGNSWPSDFLITTDGSYTMEVTTSNGCTATSDPLDILLYTGVGSITVLTYLDVDHDGMITAADMLLSGIPVQIISDDGSHAGNTSTLANGSFVFEEYPATTYTAYFNSLLLSSQWRIIIDSVPANVLTCGDSVVVSLLLAENCSVTGSDLFFESCPGEDFILGDSIWSDTGHYTVHLMSALGCDSIFEVHILRPDTFDIGSTVWVDVDQNGILSPADTVIGGITIVIDAMINQAPYIEVTDVNGSINGSYPSRFYSISVDSTLLPAGLSVLYGADLIYDTICGQLHFDFLLVSNCLDVFMFRHEEICEGDSILIEGQWITDPGVYSFLLSQPGSGCDTTMDVYVNLWPEPIIESVIDWDCIHLGTIELTTGGNSPFQYVWSTSMQADSVASGLTDGMYTVTISDVNGCSVSDTFSILSSAPLSFGLPGEYEVHAGDSVEVIITGDIGVNGISFQWWPSYLLSCDTCAYSWAFPDSNSLLSIQIIDADSCTYNLETNIVLRYDSAVFDQIYVPNVFSPNGDGINDRFSFFSLLPDVYIYELTVMDRWGQLIFHTSDIPLDTFEGWDGTFRDKPLHPQVFAYFARVRLSDGKDLKLVGDVTLVR